MSAATTERRSASRPDVYAQTTQRILEALADGVVPWRKPWHSVGGPRNLNSGRAYTGVNSLLLGLAPFSSPYWLTFKGALELDGCVRKGAKGTRVVLLKPMRHLDDDEEDQQVASKPRLLMRSYTVFNLEQCDGIDAPADDERIGLEPIAHAEAVVESMPGKPRIVRADYAAWRPSNDIVLMPSMAAFESAQAYYCTLFHELTHSTAHADRVGRVFSLDNQSPIYAREELVAEIGGAMLCNTCGIAPDDFIDQSASYIDHWRGKLEEDSKLIVQAASQAQKAADFILGRCAREGEGR